ncbi:helix-turn-helix domain-containing protein [Rubrivivax sp. JA1024]|nr:helix-turn-helix domain-containing protein [Rubrivivax sp. JA1024]
MSWQATAWAAKQATGSPSRKLLLLALANYADPAGRAYPSQDTLARDTEQSVDTVQRQIKQLVNLGLIRVEKRPGHKGQWAGRVYFLSLPKEDIPEPQNAAWPGDDHAAPGPATIPQKGRSPCRKAVRHEPVEQPKEQRAREKPVQRQVAPPPARLGAAGEVLAQRIGQDRFASWFSKVELVSARDGKVILAAPTKFIRDYVTTHFASEMLAAWKRTTSGVEQVTVITAKTAPP